MKLHFATTEQAANWDERILANPDAGNVFQGLTFAEQKRRGGWKTRYIIGDSIAITALEKMIPGLGRLWYIPKGPGISSVRELDELLPALRQFAKRHGVFLLKIEPELEKTDETLADVMKLGLIRAQPIQPNFSTVLIDLSPDLEDVLASLNQKGRHAIRRAERDGVIVKQVAATDQHCQLMYRLFSETAAGSFRIRSYEYYKAFWQSYTNRQQGRLFFAYVDGQVVAGAFALIYGTKSTYKDGASIRERTVYGASHLLQWHVIEWAKQRGSKLHDLCGVPPRDQITNEDHPHYGLGRFKTSFNKTVTEYVGVLDVVIHPVQYKLWTRIGERLAIRLHSRRFHENFY